MKNTGNAIVDALGHLEQAGIEEEKRMAMVKATLELQQPVLESIEDLASKMDTRIEDLVSRTEASIQGLRSDMHARFEKLESKWDARFEKMESSFANLRVETAKRDTWLIIAVISLAATVAGFLFRIQSLTAL